MKKDIHPQMHPVIFRDTAGKKDFIMHSTLTSEKKEKVGGVDHYVILLDVSSATHPFYTGSQHLVDSSGRVEKFKAKMAKARPVEVKKTTNNEQQATSKKEEKKEEPKAELKEEDSEDKKAA